MQFEIWVEGYRVTGEHGRAQRICDAEGETFSDACYNAWCTGKFEGWGHYNSERVSLFSCRLFDNRIDAQEAFG